MGNLLNLAIYNPALLSDEDFIASFVARENTVKQLLKRLGEITLTSLAQHNLLLGQRGMGKTSLLRRLAIGVAEDSAMNDILLPLTFREEQYNVHNLQVFWCNCLDALGDWFEKNGQTDKANEIDDDVAKLSRDKTDMDGNAALEMFKSWVKREGKRPILLLDNLDIILSGLKKQQWDLRRVLQESGGIVVIGASTYYMETVSEKDAAFYDFFQVTVLEKLSHKDLMNCLRRLAEARGPDGRKVMTVIDQDPGRIHTLYDLTGGNPRTLTLLYLLLELDGGGDVFSDLERLLDQVTVLYKARVEDLSAQARVVLDALALAWNPITAAGIADASGLSTGTVSTSLDRMSKDGLVEKATLSSTARTAFQLSERFFNIWYLMRHAPRRQRTRLRWLTGFLRSFYTPKQLTDRAMNLLRRNDGQDFERRDYFLALGDAIDDPGWRNLLGSEIVRELRRHATDDADKVNPDVQLSEIPTPVTSKEWLVQGSLLSGDLARYKEAENAYRNSIKLNPKKAASWVRLGILLDDHLERYDEAEAAYRKAIEFDPKRAGAWVRLGILLDGHLKRYDEAEAAYRKAIDLDPKRAGAWGRLGILLHDHFERYDEAEGAYRKFIELYPKQTAIWNLLASLLELHLKRYDEAEAAYRKAIELNPKQASTWDRLGNLLDDHLDRYDEAEAAYRKAIELDPKQAGTWGRLGILLDDHFERYDEAEAAYRKAVELDPKHAGAWGRLGILLHDHLERYDEAEGAYRKIIELDPKQAATWNLLANLLELHLERYEEAGEAYRRAAELDGTIHTWCSLGNILLNRLGRVDEAMEAYGTAITIKPANSDDWGVRGYLLFYLFDQREEAADAYKQALKMEPDSLVHRSNILALHLLDPNHSNTIVEEFEAVVTEHPASGAALLAAIRAMAGENFGEASSAFQRALDADDPEIFDTYRGFFVLFLRLAVSQGYGEKLLRFFEEQGVSERHWPVYAALDAYVHGEKRLMDVNPEVRGVAAQIYAWLDTARKAA